MYILFDVLGIFTYIYPKNIQTWPSFVGKYDPAPWVLWVFNDNFFPEANLRHGLRQLVSFAGGAGQGPFPAHVMMPTSLAGARVPGGVSFQKKKSWISPMNMLK